MGNKVSDKSILLLVLFIGTPIIWSVCHYWLCPDSWEAQLFFTVAFAVMVALLLMRLVNNPGRQEAPVSELTDQTPELPGIETVLAVKMQLWDIIDKTPETGFGKAVDEVKAVFQEHPDMPLHKWDVFRSWYKHHVDIMCDMLDGYELVSKTSGVTYRRDDDTWYDPQACDWPSLLKQIEADGDECDDLTPEEKRYEDFMFDLECIIDKQLSNHSTVFGGLK